MEKSFRSVCPLSTSLDILGDKWSLLIIRDMLFKCKMTFKEFAASSENIATNILAARLKMLEQYQIITKEKHRQNKKVNLYVLTSNGLKLLPVLLEIVLWSDHCLKGLNPSMVDIDINNMMRNPSDTIKKMEDHYLKTVSQFM